jgi:hypothetical protein
VLSEACRGGRTDDERNHGGSVTTGLCQALDELLDLPHFNVLLGLVGLLLFTHVGGVCVVRAVGTKAVGRACQSKCSEHFFQSCGGARRTVAPVLAGAAAAAGMVQGRWRGGFRAISTYRLCAESGWVERGVRVDGVAVTRRVCGERKCVVLRPQRPPFSELRTSRHSLFPAFARLCLLAQSRCNNNNMSVILQESTHKTCLTRQVLS